MEAKTSKHWDYVWGVGGMELGEDRDRVGAVTGLCCGSDAVVVRQQARGLEMFEEKS